MTNDIIPVINHIVRKLMGEDSGWMETHEIIKSLGPEMKGQQALFLIEETERREFIVGCTDSDVHEGYKLTAKGRAYYMNELHDT